MSDPQSPPEIPEPFSLDRYQGCLLGLAAGDALGTTVEFFPPGAFPPMSDIIGEGPFDLEPGQWTDDTSMALCLAESLLENGWDLKDQMNRYVRWWRQGENSSTGECFDIGGTVSSALDRYMEDGNPIAGSTDPFSAGNGSLMRLAPVPMFYARDRAEAIRRSGESSLTTHGARTCIDACRHYGGLGRVDKPPKNHNVFPCKDLSGPHDWPVSKFKSDEMPLMVREELKKLRTLTGKK